MDKGIKYNIVLIKKSKKNSAFFSIEVEDQFVENCHC